ncbi:MAG: acylphosphatase [Caulobacteraceae bacterium]
MEKIVRLRIVGLVQGVGYRAFVRAEAERIGLRGWVRNRADRSVEAIIAGPGEAVGEMIVVCRRGPVGGRVEAVDVEAAEPGDLGEDARGGFAILRTF